MLKNIKNTIEKKNGHYKEKVLQFGEGNFLRAFVDWMIDEANDEGLFDGSIVLVQPINMGMVNMINDQDGLYTLVMRGLENGKKTEKVKAISLKAKTSRSSCQTPQKPVFPMWKATDLKTGCRSHSLQRLQASFITDTLIFRVQRTRASFFCL